MLRKIELLIPSFLKEFDSHLLKTRPGLWSTKIHYVLFFGLVGLALLLLKVAVTPVSFASIPSIEVHVGWMFIPIILAFGLYVYRVSLFNVEKKFGQRKNGEDLRNQLILLGVVMLLGAIPFIYGYSLSSKISNSIDNAELVADINTLHQGEYYMPDYYETKNGNSAYNERQTHNYRPYNFNAAGVENKYYGSQNDEEALEHIANYLAVFEKYSGEKISYSPQQILTHSKAQKVIPNQHFPSVKYEIDQNIQEIANAKRFKRWDRQAKNGTKAFGLVLFGLFMAFQLFLKAGWRRFLIAVAGGFGIAVAGGVAAGFSSDIFNIKFEHVLWPLYLVAMIFFIGQAYKRKNTKVSNAWKSVSLMFSAVMVGFFPFATLMTDRYFSDNEGFAAMYLGAILLFFVWNVAFSKHFTKLQSMPMDN